MYTKKYNSYIFCVGTEIIVVITENIVEIPHETRNRITLWHNNTTTEYVSKEGKNISTWKIHQSFHVLFSKSHNSQDAELALVSIKGWIEKENLYVGNRIYLSILKLHMTYIVIVPLVVFQIKFNWWTESNTLFEKCVLALIKDPFCQLYYEIYIVLYINHCS